MPTINSGTYLNNFLTSITTSMRLPQPEPQYVFAQMAISAGIRMEALKAGMNTAQQFVSMASEGKPVSAQLDQLARFADTMPDAVLYKAVLGKEKGDTVKFQRPVYAGGGYSIDARKVWGDKATSTTGQVISAEEVSITLDQLEGPYSSSGSAVQPYAVRLADGKFKNPINEVSSEVTHHLRRDYIKLMDTIIRDQFCASPTYVTFVDNVANAGALAAGKIFETDTIIEARTQLAGREWSPFPNGRYVCLVPIQFNGHMLQDTKFRELTAFHRNENPIMRYIGSIQDVDIYECSTLSTYAAGTPYAGTNVAGGVTAVEALLIGPGAVGFANAEDPACHFHDDTDYGKVAKVIWRATHGFGVIDHRGIQRICASSV